MQISDIKTTEETGLIYINKLISASEQQAKENNFSPHVGTGLLSFVLDALVNDIEVEHFEAIMRCFLEVYCKTDDDIMRFYQLFHGIVAPCQNFILYVRNTQLQEWIEKNEFLSAWRENGDGTRLFI